MRVFVSRAALLCEECGEAARADLIACGIKPPPEGEADSDSWPIGPYGDGGGEADSPQHCDHCGVFLENPLTDDGREYVRAELYHYEGPADDLRVAADRAQAIARRARMIGRENIAEWADVYGATLWGAL